MTKPLRKGRATRKHAEAKEKEKEKEQEAKLKPPRLNQFGRPMATAEPIKTVVTAWICSACKTVNFGTNGKRPFRCKNRKTCGRLFHD